MLKRNPYRGRPGGLEDDTQSTGWLGCRIGRCDSLVAELISSTAKWRNQTKLLLLIELNAQKWAAKCGGQWTVAGGIEEAVDGGWCRVDGGVNSQLTWKILEE